MNCFWQSKGRRESGTTGRQSREKKPQERHESGYNSGQSEANIVSKVGFDLEVYSRHITRLVPVCAAKRKDLSIAFACWSHFERKALAIISCAELVTASRLHYISHDFPAFTSAHTIPCRDFPGIVK